MRDNESVKAALGGFWQDMDVYRQGGLFRSSVPGGSVRPELRRGDVLLRLLAQPSSVCIASAMLSGYSHCAVAVDTMDGLKVADFFPGHECNGGTRLVPAETWLEGEEQSGLFHCLVLRHPDLNAERLPHAVASLSGEFTYRYFADASFVEYDAEARRIGNCSTYLMSVFKQTGPELHEVCSFGEVNRLGVITFLELLRSGFYDVFKAEGATTFYDLAQKHNALDMIGWQGNVLPPAFPEFAPGFEVVGYIRSSRPNSARFEPWLNHYRRRVPAMRAAVRCHGLIADQIPSEIVRAAGSAFKRALVSQPAGSSLDAVACNRCILMNEVREPATYVTIPLSAGLAAKDIGPIRLLAARAMLAAAPAILALARAVGWSALQPFSKFSEGIRGGESAGK